MTDRAEIVVSACALIDSGNLDAARTVIIGQYPPAELSTQRSSWTQARLLRVFMRDGFTDRYFGVRLVFPGALRMLSLLVPEAFPYHAHWKQSETHPAFWELYPSIDHVVPLARGGTDDESNIVTTSMLRNGAKSNWLLEELGWPTERAAVAGGDWDGMLGWFLSQWKANGRFQENAYLRQWHRAVIDL